MSERKLVTIQTVTDVQPIHGADAIEQARVMGWTVVVKKGEFRPGDPCVFFEIDSVLPDGPVWAEFLRPRGFRVKTLRLRGVLSQGLALPLSILGDVDLTGILTRDIINIIDMRDITITRTLELALGSDVASLLGVTKYEPELPNTAEIAAPFPARVPKTDEIRLQSCPGVLDEIRGADFYITTKCDGMSATYLRTEEDGFTAASRNWTLKPGAGQIWQVANSLRLAERLPWDFAIQGEICGPGVQKNRMGLSELQLYVFNVYDVRNARYLDFNEFESFCADYNLQTVPVTQTCQGETASRWDHSLNAWLDRATGFYYGTKNRKEGIVVRPMKEMRSDVLGGRLSFKVINNDYLLKDES